MSTKGVKQPNNLVNKFMIYALFQVISGSAPGCAPELVLEIPSDSDSSRRPSAISVCPSDSRSVSPALNSPRLSQVGGKDDLFMKRGLNNIEGLFYIEHFILLVFNYKFSSCSRRAWIFNIIFMYFLCIHKRSFVNEVHTFEWYLRVHPLTHESLKSKHRS